MRSNGTPEQATLSTAANGAACCHIFCSCTELVISVPGVMRIPYVNGWV